MTRADAATKMEQSRRITNIGCFGLILVVILLVLIGIVVARTDISGKRAEAMGVLDRMRDQAEKAPGIFNRMLPFGCGAEAERLVGEAGNAVESLGTELTLAELDEVWGKIEDAWSAINRGCRRSLSEPAFVDLTTEMEGVRNRYMVEKGNYNDAAEVYNSALDVFPGNLAGWGFEKL